MEEKKATIKRLGIDIPMLVHDKLKIQAIFHNCSLSKYVLQAVLERLKRDEQYQ